MENMKIGMVKITLPKLYANPIGGSLFINAVTRTDEIRLAFNNDFNNDFR